MREDSTLVYEIKGVGGGGVIAGCSFNSILLSFLITSVQQEDAVHMGL